jgi:ribosomal protein L7Ae-like RNA K-turn-binding protein
MDKWQQQLHFVIKAKAFLTGELAIRSLKTKRVYYVILAEDVSASHRQTIIERLDFYHIPYRIALTKDMLATFTQKKQVVMLAITNKQLAQSLIEKETTYEETRTSSSGKYPG